LFELRTKLILFKAKGAKIEIDLFTPREFGDQFAPVMDDIAETVTLTPL